MPNGRVVRGGIRSLLRGVTAAGLAGRLGRRRGLAARAYRAAEIPRAPTRGIRWGFPRTVGLAIRGGGGAVRALKARRARRK